MLLACAPAQAETPPPNRVASIYLSEDFINEQLTAHSKSQLIKDLKLTFDPGKKLILVHGKLQVPVEELRAINLDPSLGAFRFQLTIQPQTTAQGYLILDFPLEETYFYPATSKNTPQDRIIVPTQMISLALASARGYLSALSGDFSSFDRRTQKLSALIKGLDHLIAKETNADAKEEFKNQRQALHLQLQAVPIERKQLEGVAKQVEHIMGFTGEKELNLNDELGARKNGLVLKIKMSQLAPFLSGVELGGVRLVRDHKDGHGGNYLSVDVNSVLAENIASEETTPPADRPGLKSPPAVIMKINQSIFESALLVQAEKKKLGDKIRKLSLLLKDDGMHVNGEFHSFFFNIPFDTVVDFVTTGTDVFEARVRELKLAGMDFEFLTSYVLEALQARLDTALHGICHFKYVGEEKDHSRALQVTVQPKSLIPAFPDLHLLEVDVREKKFLLKIGHP